MGRSLCKSLQPRHLHQKSAIHFSLCGALSAPEAGRFQGTWPVPNPFSCVSNAVTDRRQGIASRHFRPGAKR